MAGLGQILSGIGLGGPASGMTPGIAPPEVTNPQAGANVEQNKSLWRDFLGKLNDPNVRQSLLMGGLTLMQSPKYGENGFDMASHAGMVGVQTLEGLRQRDRQQRLLDEDRALKEQQRQTENQQKDRQLTTSEGTAKVYADTSLAQTQQGKDKLALAERELQEAIRHNKSQEEIGRLQAAADRIRAQNSGAGGGTVPAKVQLVNMLSAQLQAEKGLSKTEADAQAVEMIEFGARSKNPGEMARQILMAREKAYAETIEGFTAPPTAEMRRQWAQEAVQQAQAFAAASAGAQPGIAPPPGSAIPGPAVPGSPVPPTTIQPAPATAAPTATPPTAPPAAIAAPTPAPAPVGAPPAAPVAPQPMNQAATDARVQAVIAKAREKGQSTEAIRSMLIKNGFNPQRYGL